jgi:hypothetical protein
MARGIRSGISGGEVQIAAVGWGTSHSVAATLEPAINFPAGDAGSQFFSVPEARSDEYRESSSDKRRRNEENWPQPFGFHPVTECVGGPGVAAKIAPYFVVVLGSGAATTFVLRLVWRDFLSQRRTRES